MGVVVGVLFAALCAHAAAEEPRMIDVEPYDQLVLKGDERVFRLAPLPMVPREPLRDREAESQVIVCLFDRPEQKYQVQWKAIERIELFEELVLGEAATLVARKSYEDAHQYYSYLHARAPAFPGLAAARQDCLASEAKDALTLKRYDRAWLVLLELHAQNQDYPGLREIMGSAVHEQVEDYLARGQDAAARELVEQLATRFVDHEEVLTRRQQLQAKAHGHVQAARAAVENQQWRAAHDAVQAALSTWPELDEAQQLVVELQQRYPIVRVGVREVGSTAETQILTATWPQLRQQGLTDRCLRERAAPSAAVPSDRPAADIHGPYRRVAETGGEVCFGLQPDYFSAEVSPPCEVVEQRLGSLVEALRALERRQILVYDRVLPWELATARTHAEYALVPYATPTVQLLVPNPHSALLTSGAVRRAIDLALDRERILRDVLGDGITTAGVTLSGPFPRGSAYDDQAVPTQHDSRTAVALLHRGFDPGTDDTPMRRATLAYVPSETARRAAVAIQGDLRLNGLGIDVTLRELTAEDGVPSAQSWDMLLVEWPAMESARDAQTLFESVRWGRSADPELDLALEQLMRADGSESATTALHAIHRRTQESLSIIPLWQFDEYALVHRALLGVGERPATLYQHVEHWQVAKGP